MEPQIFTKILSKSFFIRDDTIKTTKELLGKFLITNIDGKGLTGGMIVEAESYLGPIDKASHGYNSRRTKRNESLYKEGGAAYVYLCYGMYYLFNIVTNKIDIPHGILIRAIEPSIGIDIMLQRKRNINKQKNKRKDTAPLIHNAMSDDDLSDAVLKKDNLSLNRLTSGPGLVSIALGIDSRHNGIIICKDDISVQKNDKKLEYLLYKDKESNIANYNIKNNINNDDYNKNKNIPNNKLDIWLEDRGITIPEKDIVSTARIGVDYAKEHASLPWRFKIKNNKWVSK